LENYILVQLGDRYHAAAVASAHSSLLTQKITPHRSPKSSPPFTAHPSRLTPGPGGAVFTRLRHEDAVPGRAQRRFSRLAKRRRTWRYGYLRCGPQRTQGR